VADGSDLWERIRIHDASAFEAFYRNNAGRLCAYLQQIVGSRQVAEDLMQETFIQIWKSPNGFQPELGSLRGYLFGIGRKRAAEWWRKRRVVSEERAERGDEPAKDAASLSAVADVFGRLSEEQRSILWLREVEGESYAEIATILQIPVGTVKSRLFVAREELRRMWRSSCSAARS
jgi:RNA polymerase sigma-70 factor (ECF subfamily)